MSSLQLFEFSGQDVRTLNIDGEPWFVLNDLCAVLEIANPRDVATRIDPLTVGKTDAENSRGQMRETTIVNESGMYEVVIRANGDLARTFRRWLTSEVLPAIRKTGSFIAKPKSLEEQALEIMGALQERVADQARELEVARPLAEHTKQLRQSAGLETVGDVANRIQVWAAENAPGYKVLHKDVWELAGELDIIIRGNTVRHNRATSQALKSKWVRESATEVEHNSGKKETKYSTRLTHKGSGRIWDKAITRIQNDEPIFVPKQKVA